jgi:hypothetical protein
VIPDPELPPIAGRALASLRADRGLRRHRQAIDLYAIGTQPRARLPALRRQPDRPLPRRAPVARRALATAPPHPPGALGRVLGQMRTGPRHPLGLISCSASAGEVEAEEGMPTPDLGARLVPDRSIWSTTCSTSLGYGTDDVGEATLLAFTAAQQGGRANWLFTLGASSMPARSAALAVLRARLAPGRRTAWLFGLPWRSCCRCGWRRCAASPASSLWRTRTARHPARPHRRAPPLGAGRLTGSAPLASRLAAAARSGSVVAPGSTTQTSAAGR